MLPARLPNILLNGTTGIAVGMATDIPPHNLREVAQAAIALIDQPKPRLDQLLDIVQGRIIRLKRKLSLRAPRFVKSTRTTWFSAYARGLKKEDGAVVISALPHQGFRCARTGANCCANAQQKLPMVDDLRDESDHENPTCSVIVRAPTAWIWIR